MSDQTIFRTVLTRDFATLPNEFLRDKRLSFKARGLGVMVLSNRDDWNVTCGWLETQTTEGREAIRGALAELQTLGYATLEKSAGEKGRFRYLWTFYDTEGHFIEKTTVDGLPSTANRQRLTVNGKPYASSNTIERKQSKKKKELPPIPETLAACPEFLIAWKEWLDYRRERKPVSARAAQEQFKDLVQWGPQKAIEAISNSIKGDYQGLFKPKETKRLSHDPDKGTPFSL